MANTETPFSLLVHPTKTSDKQCDFFDAAHKMVTIHNGIVRPLNAIYQQAPFVSEKDISSFILYCQAWSHSLHHHHGIEEEIFFPEVERITGLEGLMDGNVQQHREFEIGLKKFDEYVNGAQKSLASKKPTEKGFDGQKLREIIDSFGPALRQHLGDEIPTILALKEYEGKLDIGQIFRDIDAKIQKEGTIAEAAYVACSGAVDLLESAPTPIRVLICLIASWMKLTGSYKFAPCSGFGVPQSKLYASGNN